MVKQLLLAVLSLCLLASFVSAQTYNLNNTLLAGQGLTSATAGTPAQFTVQLRYTNNTLYTVCPAVRPFNVSITGPVSVSVQFACYGGNYRVSYTNKVAGNYTLTITDLSGRVLPNGTYKPTLVPAAIYGPYCTVPNYLTVGNFSGVVGQTYTYQITPYDQYKNLITSCPVSPSAFTVSFSNVTVGSGSVYSCDRVSGKYSANFSGTRSQAQYAMTVRVSNLIVSGQSLYYQLTPGAISPANSIYTGKSTVNAGQLTTFTVQARDLYNNTIATCDPVVFNSSLTSGQVYVPVSYIGCSGGVYSLSYTAQTANTYSLAITINGTAVGQSPYSVSVQSAIAIDPSRTTASGPGLSGGQAGVPAIVVIRPVDQFGNPNLRCDPSIGSNFHIQLAANIDPTGVTCSGQYSNCDPTTGYFQNTWVCTNATNYTLTITYLSNPIGQGPWTNVLVVPGPVSGAQTTADGAGRDVAYAGEKSIVYLHPEDQFGNVVTSCDSDEFDPSQLDIQITTTAGSLNGTDGKYEGCVEHDTGAVITVSYNLTQTTLPNLQLAISYGGQNVVDSPFPLITYPGAPTAASCNATGPGLSLVVAGTYGEWSVRCSDMFGNVIYLCEDLNNWNWALGQNGASYLHGKPYSCVNGSTISSYAVTSFHYNETTADQYRLNISYQNNSLDPAYPVVVAAALDPSNTIAVGDGVTRQDIPAGNRTQFLILARDRFGNDIKQCLDQSKINIVPNPPLRPNSTFTILPCSLTKNQTTVQYSSTFASTYQLDISYDSVPISGGPYTPTIVSGPIDPSTIVASGPGLAGSVAGVTAQITLKANDIYNNPVNVCDMTFTDFDLTLVHGATTVQGHVYKCVNGVYRANYTATVAGYYNLTIQYNKQEIPSSPFLPLIVAGPADDAQSTVYVQDGLTIFQAGEAHHLVVSTRDAYGNPVTTCTPGLAYTALFVGAKANGTTSSQSLPCTANGTYLINFQLRVATTYTTYVYGATHNVTNSPLKLAVVPADIYAHNSYVQGIPDNTTQNKVIGEAVPVSILVADIFDNVIPTCNHTDNYTRWTVYLLSNDATKRSDASVVGCSGGVYTASITATQVGLYKLYVSYLNSGLDRSPYPHDANAYFNFSYGYPSGKSYATGPGVDSSSIVAGSSVCFDIVTLNQYNYSIYECPPAPFGARNWTVSFDESYDWKKNVQSAPVQECVDGRFTVCYKPTVARQYSVDVRLDGQEITFDPYRPTVVPGPICYNQTIVSLSNSTGDNGTITLITRDCYQNNELSVDESEFDVVLTPECVASTVTKRSNGGVVYADYTVYQGGVYCPAILFENNTVRLTNQSIHAIGGKSCNSSCNYRGYCFENLHPSTVDTAFSCSCFQGWTGAACEDKMSSKYPLSIGVVIGLIVGLAVLLFLIGLLLGYFVFKFLSRRGGYNNI